MSQDFDYLSAVELKRLIATKQASPVEITRRSLAKAEATQGSLNCFSTLTPESAMASARIAEDAVMKGAPLGALHGLPVSVKDLIAVKDVPFCSGSRAMAKNVAAVDAPSVERLRAAGAIIIGKTTTSEFGCKPVGDNLLTGVTRHPWNLAKTPGGSSAGAVSSVAAGITPFALGTDGGGSIRIPCAFTGLSGLKGQFGRIPVAPVSATPTLAHVGPIARNAGDTALLFAAVAGHDRRDPFSVAGPVPDVLTAVRAQAKGLRIAWSPTLGYARPDREVTEIVGKAVRQFEEIGCEVELVEKVFDADPADLWTAEFYAGVGTRLRGVIETQRDLLDPAVAEVLEQALSQEMRDYYTKVFERYALREKMRQFFEGYDLIISPILPVTSLDIGKNIPDHITDRNLVSWIYYTYPFNLTGQPGAAVCAGIASDGMPVGMQIIGTTFGEYDVMRAAAAFERMQPEGYNIRHFDEKAA